MHFVELLGPAACAVGLAAGSKHRLLEDIARRLAPDAAMALQLLDALNERERLGGTGLGAGAALPHGRCEGLTAPRAGLFRLARGVDFGAADGVPVDLVAVLAVPVQYTTAQLALLAEMAEALADPDLRQRLRAAADAAALRAELAEWTRRAG